MENMPIWLTHSASIVCGLVVGSFLNVVVCRLPHEESVVKPGSRCPHCKKSIAWWNNIPVLSYLVLLGKCGSCRHPISLRYPVIELLTALLFLTVEIRFGWTPVLFVRDWPFVALLVAITFIDLEHRIIPDTLSLGGLLLGLLTCWMVSDPGWLKSLLGAGFGFFSFYSLAWLYEKMSGRSGLGGGDIKLLAMIGAFVGPGGVFATIFISSIFGSVVGIGWALVRGKKNIMKLSLPYGPFLVTGALYYYLLGDILWFQFMIPM
jgi:leader peptidase (prepilin peptidase)/N-methyltransferase